MPRYRKLYVKTTESLDLNDMPDDFTRLMWVLMPLCLCREGRGLDHAAWLKSKLFPLRVDVTLDMIIHAMDWFTDRGMIVPYVVDDRQYFYVPTFHRYQGDTTREAETNYPPPPEQSTEDSRPTQELVTSKSCSDAVCNMQYSDSEAEGAATAPAPTPPKPKRKKTPTPEPVKTFREAVHRYPPKGWYEEITSIVGTDPPKLKLWYRVCHAWVGVGWNPQNVQGMLDCFQRGEIPGKERGNGRGKRTVEEMAGATRLEPFPDQPALPP
jgi:hypothetical protein